MKPSNHSYSSLCITIRYGIFCVSTFLLLLIPNHAWAGVNPDNTLTHALAIMLQTLFIDGPGQIGLIVVCFLFIIILLRFLYGPRGVLRDPHWDQLNAQSQAEEQHKRQKHEKHNAIIRHERVLIPLMDLEQTRFLAYVQNFIHTENQHRQMLQLKRDHTLRVVANAWNIIQDEASFSTVTPPPVHYASLWDKVRSAFQSDESLCPDRLLLLSALYHDLGRFEQLKQFGTFQDGISFNHAAMSSKLLQSPQFLVEQSDVTRRLVRTIILLHNRPELPQQLSPLVKLPARALQDADKIDILRILHQELTAKTVPDPTVTLNLKKNGPCSEAIIHALEQKHYALYTDMQTINDFRLLLGSWFYALHFDTSRQMVIQEGKLREIIQQIPEDAQVASIRHQLLCDVATAEPAGYCEAKSE